MIKGGEFPICPEQGLHFAFASFYCTSFAGGLAEAEEHATWDFLQIVDRFCSNSAMESTKSRSSSRDGEGNCDKGGGVPELSHR